MNQFCYEAKYTKLIYLLADFNLQIRIIRNLQTTAVGSIFHP